MRDVGKVISVPVSFVQVDVQTDPRWAKTNSNIPSPGKARSVKSPTPCPASPPPPHGCFRGHFCGNLVRACQIKWPPPPGRR